MAFQFQKKKKKKKTIKNRLAKMPVYNPKNTCLLKHAWVLFNPYMATNNCKFLSGSEEALISVFQIGQRSQWDDGRRESHAVLF